MAEELNYKLGEMKECDFDIISLLNFIDSFAPTKEINDDLTNKIRYLANQISYTEKRAKEIVDMGLKVMFEEGETYNPLQLEYYNKAKDFCEGIGGAVMEILIGWLHDTYTDENGAEVPYTERICGVLKDEVFKCVSIPDYMTFEMPKEEFLSKVTGIKKGAEIWN